MNMLMREKEMKFLVSVMDLVAPMQLALVRSIVVMSVAFSWLSGIQSHVHVESHRYTDRKYYLITFIRIVVR